MTIDPITLSVLQNGLMQVCNEMDLAFVRSAFSPVIAEALDRSDGIYHRDSGELIAQGELGLAGIRRHDAVHGAGGDRARPPPRRSRSSPATSSSSTTPISAART